MNKNETRFYARTDKKQVGLSKLSLAVVDLNTLLNFSCSVGSSLTSSTFELIGATFTSQFDNDFDLFFVSNFFSNVANKSYLPTLSRTWVMLV